MKIHPVFSPNKLRRDPTNPLPGQIAPEPDPIVINDEEEWEVDKILASRLYGRGRARKRLQYRVSWTGYNSRDPT